MILPSKGHLTYCTNIHPGETWEQTFLAIQKHVPVVRDKLSRNPFGIGLRLSEAAATGLLEKDRIREFSDWLGKENAYVFTMNGFPYGSFHNVKVKEEVHRPDWLSRERVTYTLKLADILSQILPEGLEGGISTSPISYRFWHSSTKYAMESAVAAFMEVAEHLHRIELETGKLIHIDIEPEPDGILENTGEFLSFYNDHLLRSGKGILHSKGIKDGEGVIRRHLQLCYDVCHYAVEFEEGTEMIREMDRQGIGIGKIQISAALRARFETGNEKAVYQSLSEFDESTYLHQAVGLKKGKLLKYRDLGPLLKDSPELEEVRSHYHVPIFLSSYGILESTQDDIVSALEFWKQNKYTSHLEVETYTWNVLPTEMQLDLSESIARELQWVLDIIERP